MPDEVPDGMQIEVNGQGQHAPAGSTVADLLRTLELRPEGVAVEVNLRILDRADYARHGLQEGDRVEIVSFIGGGGLDASRRMGAAYGGR